jgi:hypothetical protein
VACSAAMLENNCSFLAFSAFSLWESKELYFVKLNISFKSVFCKNLILLPIIHRKVDTERQLNFSIMTPTNAPMIYTIKVIIYIMSAFVGVMDKQFNSIKMHGISSVKNRTTSFELPRTSSET